MLWTEQELMSDFLTWPLVHVVSIANFVLLIWNVRVTIGLKEKVAAMEAVMEERGNRRE